MILTDKEIQRKIKNGYLIIEGYKKERLKCISYDLNIGSIITDEKDKNGKYKVVNKYYLKCGETIFIKADVKLKMPKNCVGIVYERNSIMRRGLVVDGPCYQPGHETNIFLRVHNIYANEQRISIGDPIAQIRFERLDSKPNIIYGENEVYQNEDDYRGVQGEIKHDWESQLTHYEKKVEELDNKENRIYANVLAFMGIFITLFSLLTFNFGFSKEGFSIKNLLLVDFSICMIIYFLMGIILILVNNICKKKSLVLYGILGVILIGINIYFWKIWL